MENSHRQPQIREGTSQKHSPTTTTTAIDNHLRRTTTSNNIYVGELYRKIAEKIMYDVRVDNHIDRMECGKNINNQDGKDTVGMIGSVDSINHNNINTWIGVRSLALHRPIGAGHEWDSYIRQRQQSHSSATRHTSTTRSSAAAWARQQDGGHRNENLSQHLPSEGYLAYCNLVIFIDQDECYHLTSRSQSSS